MKQDRRLGSFCAQPQVYNLFSHLIDFLCNFKIFFFFFNLFRMAFCVMELEISHSSLGLIAYRNRYNFSISTYAKKVSLSGVRT